MCNLAIISVFDKYACAAYKNKELHMVFLSRTDCAAYFGRFETSGICQTISRKGKTKYNGEWYHLRNFNPDKIDTVPKNKIYGK